MVEIPWSIYEKVFTGPLRKAIFLYLYVNGPKHIYGIAKDFYEMGITRNIRSVIETINKMREYGIFKENIKVTEKNRRVVEIDIDWEKMIDSFLEYMKNNIMKLNTEECDKLKEAFYKGLRENKETMEIDTKTYKEFLERVGKTPLFLFIISSIIGNLEDKELRNKISAALFGFLVPFLKFK